MNKYDDESYVMMNTNDNPSYIMPNKRAVERNWTFEKQNFSDGPLLFHNAYKNEDKLINYVRPIHDVMDACGFYLVNSKICDDIQFFKIDSMQLFPAIFVDDQDNYHEIYMLLNIWEKKDYLDFDNCKLDNEDEDEDEDEDEEDDFIDEVYSVEKFSFNTKKLDKIPEEQRLIFRVAKTSLSPTFVHQRVKDIFEQHKATGVRFFKVSDYETGMEYW